MATAFTPVPDWFGTRNVDGGLAVADVDGDGRPDLVVFMIDAPDGPNSGNYRVGHALDAAGTVTGGWGPWQQVPDWPFWENAGGGIALADLDGSGSLDLVVFIVDAPEGPNIGYVRVGRGLDADGVVTGGWGPWQQVPDWPFWENAGADCAVADIDGDGVPELVLLVVDAPVGRNSGYYRSASLDPDGTARDWAPWTAVPDWRFDSNAGAGLAVADLDGDGTPELLVLAVDDVVGRDDAYHTVGWHLDGRGRPAGGWGPWQPVPGWVFHENQGAAAALADLDGDGRPELAVLAVDDPVGTNAGLLSWLPVETDLATAAEVGVWRLLEVDSGVLAVHAALLPTGSVLFFAGSSNDPDQAARHEYGTRVWHYPGRATSARPRRWTCSAAATRSCPTGGCSPRGAPGSTTRSTGWPRPSSSTHTRVARTRTAPPAGPGRGRRPRT
jgi:FG-GAP repeat.